MLTALHSATRHVIVRTERKGSVRMTADYAQSTKVVSFRFFFFAPLPLLYRFPFFLHFTFILSLYIFTLLRRIFGPRRDEVRGNGGVFITRS